MNERQRPQSLFESLKSDVPVGDLVRRAVEELTSPNEMNQFLDEYATWIAENSPDDNIRSNPIQAQYVAGQNIGFELGYHGEETARRWLNAIEGLHHPVFGTDLSFWKDPLKAFELGSRTGRELGK